MSDHTLMTYAELADALGIEGDSARALVRRRRWRRIPGNDGLARVEVPGAYVVEHAPANAPAAAPAEVADDAPAAAPDASPANAPAEVAAITTVLGHVIERWERDVADLRADRDAERARASALQAEVDTLRVEAAVAPALRATVEALKGALESDRSRIAELRAERDRITARRPWWWRRAG
jgi:pyruvate/2-oxoglutarate dehydrogenase complex dihydrolipoamide acyltransferase (E2) component